MAFWDKFLGKQANINTSIFSFLLGIQPPEMKGRDFLAAYRGWVYACVNAISEEVGTLELKLMRITADGKQEVTKHIALDLLNNVNPFMSSSDLLLSTQAYLDLAGDAFWYLPPGSVTRKPAEIWVLDPTRMSVIKNSQTFIGGYSYKNEAGQEIPLPVNQVIQFKRFNPLNRYRGIGTVQAAAMAIDIDTFSAQWNKTFFANSAVPSAVLETEGTLTEEQFNRIKASWDVSHVGAENAHKLAILQGGLKFKSMNLSQKDMDFLEQRRFTRDEILGIFRVPKTVLGITEDVNRANAEASEFVFAKRVVKPRMQFIVDRLNEFYIPLFGEDPIKLFFEFVDPVPENVELDLRRFETGLRSGFLTINEVRAEEGLPPVKNGNTAFISSILIPLGQVEEPAGKAVKKIRDKATEDRIEKRRQFLINEIKRRKPKFMAILNQAGDQIANAVESFGEKNVKAKVDDITRVAFRDYDIVVGSLKEELTDTLETSLKQAGRAALIRAGAESTFDLENPRVTSFLQEHALQSANSISGSLKDAVKQEILDGVDEDLGPAAIARNIRGFFDAESSFRAQRIARTEVVSGFQEGNLEGYLQSGNVVSKKWLTAGDELVDDDCLANEADGEIPLDAGFSSGDFAPPVHPNCRCDLIPIAGEAEKTTLYDQVKAKVDVVVEERLKKAEQSMKISEASVRIESERILEKAREDSLAIVEEAKMEAKKERSGVMEELKGLKDKVLELVYGKEE